MHRLRQHVRLRNVTLLPALVLLTAAAIPAAAPAKTKPTCKRSNSTTVAENRVARIFTRQLGRRRTTPPSLFGCWRKDGYAQSLTRRFDDCVARGRYSLVRLHGRFIAFYSRSLRADRPADCAQTAGPIRHFLHVVNLRNESRYVTEVPDRPAAGRLLLDARGAIAWPSWLPQNQVEILYVDGSGSGEFSRDTFGDATGDVYGNLVGAFDSGAIHPESLRLRSLGGIEWIKDGVLINAPLTPFMR